ncbi:hypothetical protein Drorol1_Dr00011259, partial [Drosera rotundifolia]
MIVKVAVESGLWKLHDDKQVLRKCLAWALGLLIGFLLGLSKYRGPDLVGLWLKVYGWHLDSRTPPSPRALFSLFSPSPSPSSSSSSPVPPPPLASDAVPIAAAAAASFTRWVSISRVSGVSSFWDFSLQNLRRNRSPLPQDPKNSFRGFWGFKVKEAELMRGNPPLNNPTSFSVKR